MAGEPIRWSEERQKRLQGQLIGMWAEDTWIIVPTNPKHRGFSLRFTLASPSLKVELKYALWNRLGGAQTKLSSDTHILQSQLDQLLEWLNGFTPPVRSLMDESLEQWEESLRSYLVQKGKLKRRKNRSLIATQESVERTSEDRRISLLRYLYKAIQDAYDDRSETEKDVWDARAIGLAPDAVYRRSFLYFTPITQPWLRSLAKEYIKYEASTRSFSTCVNKLYDIVSFSRFLTQRYADVQASGIDRSVIVEYMGYLKERRVSDDHRYQLLATLRSFFETCTFQLGIEGVVKERLIFSDELPRRQERDSREIPEAVLVQLKEHLETLPTTILRMVVILLECGMRIGELCTLPIDCLVGDEEHGWSLRSYQSKMKQEHSIPLVDDTVIQTIQAQQRDIREQWGNMCPYLFPKRDSHTQPFGPEVFCTNLNNWAVQKDIRDASGNLYHFQSHQFRHSLGMRLLNDDVPIEVIGRLLGHHSLSMTQVYARIRTERQREELERVGRRRKTVNYLGQVVRGDARANDPDAQLLRKGIRGQTLPVGG